MCYVFLYIKYWTMQDFLSEANNTIFRNYLWPYLQTTFEMLIALQHRLGFNNFHLNLSDCLKLSVYVKEGLEFYLVTSTFGGKYFRIIYVVKVCPKSTISRKFQLHYITVILRMLLLNFVTFFSFFFLI